MKRVYTYMVSNAINVVVAAIAHHVVVWGLVHFDLDLARVGNGKKGVLLVLGLGQGQTGLAQVVVWALKALVSDTDDWVQA